MIRFRYLSDLMMEEAPIFIVGANRSGTTLLRLMLNAHSRIAIPDELVYFRSLFAGMQREEWLQPQMSSEDYDAFVHSFLRRNREVLMPLSVDHVADEVCADPSTNLRRPYAHVLEKWAHVHGKERWGEKTPGNLFYADVIFDMFPKAQFIYLARDPRAGVHSMMKTSLFRGDAIVNALNRRKYDVQGLDHLRRSVPAEQRTFLRFEDLLQFPEQTLRSLCDFLGESFESDMLHYHEGSHKYMKERAVDDFNRAATRPISPAKVASWRDGLSDEEVAEVEWIYGSAMNALGYSPTNCPLPLTSRVAGWLKIAYWHVQNWRHRHAPQFILQDRIFQRSRTRFRRVINRLAPVPVSST
jgi:hypothetical protein